MSKITNNQQLTAAHFANEFAINGKVDFNNATEWLIFLYSISLLDSMNDTELPRISHVPISNLKSILKKNKGRSGDFYDQVRKTIKKMGKAICVFETELILGDVTMPKVIPIFSSIGVTKKNGQLHIRIKYNEEIAPLVLGLKQNFVGIYPPTNLHSGHAINFLLYAKAQRDRRRKYDGKTTIIRYELQALKNRLNVTNKYKQIKDFKKYVITQIIEGVNRSGMITISEIQYEKTGRKITHILFFVQDSILLSETKPPIAANTEPTTAEIEALSYAQKRAVKFLVKKGIYEGIAIRKIIPMMPSSLCEGYEDYFCEEIYQIVEEKSKAKDAKGRAAILVDWFKKGIFKNDHFSRIIENVHSRKKKLNQVKSMNREAAKNMTASEFVDWTKKQKTTIENNSYSSPKGAKSMTQIINQKYNTK